MNVTQRGLPGRTSVARSALSVASCNAQCSPCAGAVQCGRPERQWGLHASVVGLLALAVDDQWVCLYQQHNMYSLRCTKDPLLATTSAAYFQQLLKLLWLVRMRLSCMRAVSNLQPDLRLR